MSLSKNLLFNNSLKGFLEGEENKKKWVDHSMVTSSRIKTNKIYDLFIYINLLLKNLIYFEIYKKIF